MHASNAIITQVFIRNILNGYPYCALLSQDLYPTVDLWYYSQHLVVSSDNDNGWVGTGLYRTMGIDCKLCIAHTDGNFVKTHAVSLP